MPNEYIRKEFNGGSPSTTLDGAINDVVTSITVASGTGLPTGATGRFVMVVERGLGTEEKVLVTTRAGTTLQSVQRGYDGTTAQAHSSGATIEHCLDAYTLDQVNALANAMTAQYDLVMRGASANAFTRIPVGADNNVLSVQGGVPTWTAPGTASISDSSVTLAKLATAVQSLLVPAGVVSAYLGTTAPTGWLLHNQAVTSAQSLYPSLWAIAPSAWKSGSTLNIPDLTDDTLIQTGGSAAALGAEGGSMSATIAEGNLPAHAHSLGSHTHTGSTGNESSHTHGDGTLAAAAGGSHDHGGTVGSTQNRVNQGFAPAASTGFVKSGSLDIALSPNDVEAHTHTISSQADHTHDVTGSTSAGSAHSHTVTINAASGNTGSIGSGTALTTRPQHLGVNFIIKAH